MMTTETTTTTTKKTGYGACVVDSNDANKNTDGAAEASSSSNITFLELLSQNTNFLFYWLSFVVNRMGDWLTLLASISLISEILLVDTNDDTTHYNTCISLLMVVKSLPNVLCMPLGGILADTYDRRTVQIVLNVCSAGVGLLFLVAYYYQSMSVLYLATFIQDSFTGLYTPSESAMVPQLVRDKSENSEELKKASTLTSLTWSLMAAIGSAMGGILVAVVGIKGCFLIDSLTYTVGGLLLFFGVHGNFDVSASSSDTSSNEDSNQAASIVIDRQKRRRSSILSAMDGNVLLGAGCALNLGTTSSSAFSSSSSENINEELESLVLTCEEAEENNDGTDTCNMFVQGYTFAFCEHPLVGSYALLKGSMALCTAATSVLNVGFSEDSNPDIAALKLGFLFFFVGVGAILGNIIPAIYADISQPKNLARLCLLGFGFIIAGNSMMAVAAESSDYTWICLSTVIRCVGSSLIWVDSLLLIQKFTPSKMLGRVQSIDAMAALLGDCVSNLGAGILLDRYNVSPTGLSWILSLLGLAFLIIWSPLAFKVPRNTRTSFNN